MKLGIMQPYAFPYMGYYQLVSAVDHFVFLDDVNYIKRGWINRNNIIVNNAENMFTIPIANASLNKKINEHSVSLTYSEWKKDFYKTLEFAYKNHRFYNEVIDLIQLSLDDQTSLTQITTSSIKNICNYLDITCNFALSSELKIVTTREQRILDICKVVGADDYINPIGGQALYSKDHFELEGIKLSFLKTNYESKLSIIDVLMNNGKLSKKYLQEYSLL